VEAKLKSQDLLILLKIVSLTRPAESPVPLRTEGWQDWHSQYDPDFPVIRDRQPGPLKSETTEHRFSVRALADSTGVSKSQVALSLQRCHDVGLTFENRDKPGLQVHRRGLYEFLVYAVRFVFPAKIGATTRGIATGVAAPVFAGKLYSVGDDKLVWPYALGNTKGQAIEPLTGSVPKAVEHDAMLYAMLALVDSLRLGAAREKSMAESHLARLLGLKR
jgi:hypothetical protein